MSGGLSSSKLFDKRLFVYNPKKLCCNRRQLMTEAMKRTDLLDWLDETTPRFTRMSDRSGEAGNTLGRIFLLRLQM